MEEQEKKPINIDTAVMLDRFKSLQKQMKVMGSITMNISLSINDVEYLVNLMKNNL